MGAWRRVGHTTSMPLLSRIRSAPCPDTSSRYVWTARRFIAAEPSEVLAALTDPEFITLWAPVDFELEGLRGRRLRSGSHVTISGSLAGVTAEFEIDVLRADEEGLDLRARGPVHFEVTYRFVPERQGTIIAARIKLDCEPGLNARVLRAATGALLSGGALDRALGQLARELDERALLAA